MYKTVRSVSDKGNIQAHRIFNELPNVLKNFRYRRYIYIKNPERWISNITLPYVDNAGIYI